MAQTPEDQRGDAEETSGDRKSTRLNSSHLGISYAVFCLKKKKKKKHIQKQEASRQPENGVSGDSQAKEQVQPHDTRAHKPTAQHMQKQRGRTHSTVA